MTTSRSGGKLYLVTEIVSPRPNSRMFEIVQRDSIMYHAIVEDDHRGHACTCRGFTARNNCRHLRAILSVFCYQGDKK